jgi:hypothetical protein
VASDVRLARHNRLPAVEDAGCLDGTTLQSIQATGAAHHNVDSLGATIGGPQELELARPRVFLHR